MRFAILSVLVALFATFVMATAPHRAVIISWPNDTPDEIVEQSKDAIRKAQGVITHEYNIIKGFAATAPASALEMVSAMSDVYKCEIEEDGIVTTQNDKE
ncbi:protease propeptide inhibitor [Stemphylium lycopersici]|uniref:Protease propeptide inhibitor n=1 Tax=Stemphylium lycopersici TaxID=183478 RepID=A0A364N7B2_STELY|nr:protease propeptide inhibitor [Stemphylium lycopersici]RAR13215.1 protease propeptide inhibitor [Stemphylium lycopersici]